VERRASLEIVLRAVQMLPERQRDAMILRELEGRSYEQIAIELNATGGAVRQLLHRARHTVRAAATAPSKDSQRHARKRAVARPATS